MKKNEDAIFRRLFPAKTAKGDNTKKRIIEATIISIYEDGIDNLTFESIGRRIGLKPAQVRYHFFEKEDVIDRAIQFVLTIRHNFTLEKLQVAKGWQKQILAIANGYFDWVEAHPEQGATLLVFYHWAKVREKYKEMHSKMFESGLQRTGKIIFQGNAEHGMSLTECEYLGITIWSIIDGFLLYRMTTQSRNASFYRKRAIEGITKLLRVGKK